MLFVRPAPSALPFLCTLIIQDLIYHGLTRVETPSSPPPSALTAAIPSQSRAQDPELQAVEHLHPLRHSHM